MKEYSIFVDGQIAGPFPQAELEAKIKSGELPADVMVAAPGDTEWKPAKEVFGVRPGVRLSRKSEAEERRLREAREEKLDPEIRRKLMLYDLADAISVDKFSPEQAKAAVETFERARAREKYVKIGVGVGAFALVFGGLFATLNNVKLSGVNRGLLAPIMEMYSAPNEEYKKQIRATAADIEKLDALRADVEKLRFQTQPGRPSRPELVKRVVIPKSRAEFISGTISAEPVLAEVLPEGEKPEEIRIFFTQKSPSSKAKEGLQEQIGLLALSKIPLWTDIELAARVVEALGEQVPSPKGVARYSGSLREQLGQVTVADIAGKPDEWARWLAREVEVQDNQGRFYRPEEKERLLTRKPSRELMNKINSSKLKKEIENMPKDNPTKAATVRWCVQDMPIFLDKLQKFIDDNRIYYSATAREELWNAWREKYAEELKTAFAEAADAESFPLNEDGTFRIARARDNNLCLRLKLKGGDTLYVPADLRFRPRGSEDKKAEVKAVNMGKIEHLRVKQQDLLPDEKYELVKKISVGGKTYFTTGKIQKRTVNVTRKSPRLNYIEVARVPAEDEDEATARKQRNLCMLVPDEEEFNGMSVGMNVPIEKLLTYEIFPQPKEAQAPSKLSLLPEPKDEEPEEEAALAPAEAEAPEASED
ncbi:DUF4339 domain-containing protein [Candidatus Spyradosoma sp. SGI.093]|uniref:DUF4339 domain-containing protein n=1 Tax=Candidatus Spyradosoma sp. SGI.093 TaxID=3420583 RepID=UPI003D035BFC